MPRDPAISKNLNQYLRDDVKFFAIVMETHMRSNDPVGNSRQEFPQWFINQARKEIDDLDEAVDAIRANGTMPSLIVQTWDKAAALANYSMLAAYVATRMNIDAPPAHTNEGGTNGRKN